MSFQKQVNLTQAPAVAGDFASTNPRNSILSIPGGYAAGTGGLTIGLFCWVDSTGTLLTNTGSGTPTGFVSRDLQAMITTYLSEFGTVIPAGFPAGEVFEAGDFWVTNSGASAVTVRMKAFANLTTGVVTFATAGATVAGAIETKWFAKSAGAAGELIKMSSTIPG